MKKAPLGRYIIPLLKAVVFIYEEPTVKLSAKGSVILPDGRKVNITVNRRHKTASLFVDDLKEATVTEELSPVLMIHFGKTSKTFYGLVISDVRAFIADWHLYGGVKSVLPALRRFAGQY
jgi:hypothetical protein